MKIEFENERRVEGMPATMVSIVQGSLIPGRPKNVFVITISGSDETLVMNMQHAKEKHYRERMINDLLKRLGNPPEEVKDFLERMKEGGIREGTFSIEEGDFVEIEPGGA